MNNIILTGMPGCGKSTLGVILARRLGFGFLDTDLFISQKEKSTLQGIIASKGLEYFLATENEIGSEIVCDRVVIATGGSMIMAEEAMENLSNLGTVVFIRVPVSELKQRLRDYSDRGIAMKEGETIESIARLREPYYAKYADVILDYAAGDSLEQTVDKLIGELNALTA